MVCCLVVADQVKTRCHHRFADSVVVPVRSSLYMPKKATLLRRSRCRFWSVAVTPAVNSGRSAVPESVNQAHSSTEKSWFSKLAFRLPGRVTADLRPSKPIEGSPSVPGLPGSWKPTPPLQSAFDPALPLSATVPPAAVHCCCGL